MSRRSNIISEIRDERDLQVERHGHNFAVDDSYTTGQLARAAAVYALMAGVRAGVPEGERLDDDILTMIKMLWPWAPSSFNPKDQRRNLVRAAALIVAEIERLDRLEGRKAPNKTFPSRAKQKVAKPGSWSTADPAVLDALIDEAMKAKDRNETLTALEKVYRSSQVDPLGQLVPQGLYDPTKSATAYGYAGGKSNLGLTDPPF